MDAVYRVDLRRKVVQACERDTASQAEVSRFFGVSLAFVEKLLRLYRRTRALEPDRKRVGRPGLLDSTACDSPSYQLRVHRLARRLDDVHPMRLKNSATE